MSDVPDRMAPAGSVGTHDPEGAAQRRERQTLAVALVAVPAALGLFAALSAGSALARRGFLPAGYTGTPRPPIYGEFRPEFAPAGVAAVAVALAGAGLAVLCVRRARLRPLILVGGAVLFLLVFAGSVTLVQSNPREAVGGVKTLPDVRLVEQVGLLESVRDYAELAKRFENPHFRTHPPGRGVFLAALGEIWGGREAPRALTLGLLSALVVVPGWFVSLRIGGERAARNAVLLLAAAPGPVLFAFASMDAVHATLLTTAAALLLWGGVWGDGRPVLAVAGGAVLGFSTFLTYAGGFVAVFVVLLAFAKRRPREAVRVLGLAAAGGIAALVVLRAAFGFDLLEAYRATHETLQSVRHRDRSLLYWQGGNVAAWAIFAGVPIAALSVRELLLRRASYLVALLVPLAVFYALPVGVTGIIPGETERTIQYAYPYAAAAAGAGLARLPDGDGRGLGALIALAGLQAVLIEALYLTFW